MQVVLKGWGGRGHPLDVIDLRFPLYAVLSASPCSYIHMSFPRLYDVHLESFLPRAGAATALRPSVSLLPGPFL